jgi:hypothetical protein
MYPSSKPQTLYLSKPLRKTLTKMQADSPRLFIRNQRVGNVKAMKKLIHLINKAGCNKSLVFDD